jgi:hypothetical protein
MVPGRREGRSPPATPGTPNAASEGPVTNNVHDEGGGLVGSVLGGRKLQEL